MQGIEHKATSLRSLGTVFQRTVVMRILKSPEVMSKVVQACISESVRDVFPCTNMSNAYLETLTKTFTYL